ncbi:MAG: hypothetical protein WD045_08695 [Pirellulaceae bacterium]
MNAQPVEILPRQMARVAEQAGPWIDVVLTPSGRTFINGHSVTLASRLDGLRTNVDAFRGVRVLAGSNCRFDHLAEIYRVCKQYGVARIELVA